MGARIFCLHIVQTGLGAHPASYPMGIELITHFQLVSRSRIRGYVHPHPHTSSLHSAWLNTETALPLPLFDVKTAQ
jgi:hypothetical protein